MPQTVDYEALAKKYGGTIEGGSEPKAASVDYEALAKKYGGTLQGAVSPQAGAKEQKQGGPDYHALAEKHGGVVQQKTPEHEVYDSTIAEGQNAERAQQRLHEYQYGISKGLSPERAKQFALSLQWEDAEKQNLTPEQKAQVEAYATDEAKQGKGNTWGRGGAEQFGEDYSEGYTYAKAQGWNEEDAQEYGESNWQQRVFMRAEKSLGRGYHSVLQSIGDWLGEPHLPERANNPWLETDEEARETQFRTYKEADWADKHFGKAAGALDAHAANIIGGFTDLQNIALLVGTSGLGLAAEGGIGVEATEGAEKAPSLMSRFGKTAAKALPADMTGQALEDVDRAQKALQAVQDARLPVSVQKVTRTAQKLMHIGFTAQLAVGAGESLGAVWSEGKQGNLPEATGYMLDALVDGFMAGQGVRESVAHDRITHDLEEKTGEVYSGKKFRQLNDYEQAVVIGKLVEDSTEYQKAADESEKQAKKRVRRLELTQNRALREAWNPNAAARAIRKIHTDRAELEAKNQWNAFQETIRQATKKQEKAKAEVRDNAVKSTAEGREKVAQSRQDREVQSEAIQGPSITVPSEQEGGHIYYPAVTGLGEDIRFGVESAGGKYRVYFTDSDGTKRYLTGAGIFGDEASQHLLNDSDTADSLAQLSAAIVEARNQASRGEGDEEAGVRADALADVRRRFLDGELDATQVGHFVGKEPLPDEHDAASTGQLNGVFSEGKTKFFNDAADYLRQQLRETTDKSDEEIERDVESTLQNMNFQAWQEIQNNLHHVGRSGDYIVDRSGKKWELGNDGLLHGPNGRTVPLTRDGLYSMAAMQMAAYGRVGYGPEPREERVEREERTKLADRAVASVDQSLLATGLELSEEKSERTQQWIRRQQVPRDFVRTEPEEGEQKAEPETEESLGALLALVDDPNWNANHRARAIVEDAAREQGITPREVVIKKLALDDSPKGKIARLQPGDTITEGARTWIVKTGANGSLYIQSGGARIDLNPANIGKWILGKKVVTGDEITFNNPPSEAEYREAEYNRPYYVNNQNQAVRTVEEQQKEPLAEPRTEQEAQARTEQAARDTVSVQASATRAIVEAVNPKPGTSEEEAIRNVDAAESLRKTAENASAQEAVAKSQTVAPGRLQEPVPISVGLVGGNDVIVYGDQEIPVHYESVPLSLVIPSAVWHGSELKPNTNFNIEGLQPRDIEAYGAESLAYSGEMDNFKPNRYTERSSSSLLGTAVIEPGGHVASGNRRILRIKKYIENIQKSGDAELIAARIAGLRAIFNDAAEKQFEVKKRPPENGEIYIPVRVLNSPIATTQDAVKLGEIFNKPVSKGIDSRAHGVVLSRLLSSDQLNEIAEMVDSAGEGGIRAAVRVNPDYFVKLATDTLLVSEEEAENWFAKDSYGRRTLSNKGVEQLEDVLLGKVIRDPSVLTGLMDDKTGKPIVAFRTAARAVSQIAHMQGMPERDLTGKIEGALAASALTHRTDAGRVYSNDRWEAVYAPDQMIWAENGFEGGEEQEPDRVTEALWRALNGPSKAESPRTLSDALDSYLQDQTTKGGMFPGMEGFETPAESFSRAFDRQLKDVHKLRTDRGGNYKDWRISDEEFQAALQNREMSEMEKARNPKVQKEVAEKKPERTKVVAKSKKMEPPPKSPIVTVADLKRLLTSHAGTKTDANDGLRTAAMIAKFVYDLDPTDEKTPEQALQWMLENRFLGLESTGLIPEEAGSRGEWVEKDGWAKGILRLHQAADISTFIHEFSHAAFPLLDEESLRAINSMEGPGPKWDGSAKGLKDKEVWKSLNEKFAHGVELTLKNREHVGFDEGQRKVLGRIRDVFAKLYASLRNDPLSPFKLNKNAQNFFDDMFGFDPEVDARAAREKKLRASEAKSRRLTRPEEQPHWIHELAEAVKASDIRIGLRNTAGGTVTEKRGEPLRLTKKSPVTELVFPSQEAAEQAVMTIDHAMEEKRTKLKGWEQVDHKNGTWGIRFNGEPPETVLQQGLREPDEDVELERLKREYNNLPAGQPARRIMLEMQIRHLESRIRPNEKVEPPPSGEVVQKAYEEHKNARADSGRTPDNAVSRFQKPEGTGGIPERAIMGMPRHAAAADAGRGSLRGVTGLSLAPLSERGTPTGIVEGESFDQKRWDKENAEAGLPKLPYPVVSISPSTAAMLDAPGQAATTVTALSALMQGDGALVANATGSGKTRVAMAIIKEHDQPLNLYVTRNETLLRNARKTGRDNFGISVSFDAPKPDTTSGTFGVSYQSMLREYMAAREMGRPSIYESIPWDLVVADESGEARNWYQTPQNGVRNQGQTLKAVMDKAKKGVYMSATPFHSPMEYGYLDKLKLWPKGGFEKWLQDNEFSLYNDNGTMTARLAPEKQEKLRAQLIERGQMISQAISYEGFTAHFGVVPVTNTMMSGLEQIGYGFAKAKDFYTRQGKTAMANRVAAFEATYTKNYLERQRLSQAIDIAKQALDKGYQVIIASEQSGEDLFHRDREGKPSAFQQLDDDIHGQLRKIVPPLPDVFDTLHAQFGDRIGDYSGRGNSIQERERDREAFMNGERPMLYTTLAAGGIGIDLHDMDGDKPRVMIILGPPYSGVLFEQAMGRPWRIGVKSDVHLVILATDAEPDVNLIHTKVAPRMRALRASVLGEKDSLAEVMNTYSSEDQKRLRSNMLAYSEGDEMKVQAANYRVRSRSREVGVSDWSQINFPSAEEAKNKGMRFGKMPGGDWSTLYQSRVDPMKVPDNSDQAEGKEAIDSIAQSVMDSDMAVSPVQNLDPATRQAEVGAASAMAATEVDIPVDRDREAVARQTMKRALNIPQDMDLRFETRRNWWGKKRQRALWKFPEGTTPIFRTEVVEDSEPKDETTVYVGWGSMKGGMESIARQAGTPEVGLKLTRMIGEEQRDTNIREAQLIWYAKRSFTDNGLDLTNIATVSEVMDVMRGKTASNNPAVNQVAAEMRDWFNMARDAVLDAGVKKKNAKTGAWEKWMPRKDYDWHHIIDWNGEVEYQNPTTGETERHKLKDVMKRTFAEEKRRSVIIRLAGMAKDADGNPVSPEAMDRYLRQRYKRGTPVQAFQEERSIDFPIIRRDFGVVENYARQIAKAIAIEQHFGSDRGKLDAEIEKIPSVKGRRDIKAMFDALLSPQELSGSMLPKKVFGMRLPEVGWNQFTNALTTFTALTKMPLSFAKVPLHATHMIYALHGDVRPMVKGMADLMMHSKMRYEDAVFLGTIARDVDFTGVTDQGQRPGLQHMMFDVTMFNTAYKIGRMWAANSGRIWMEQYAMHGLKKGGRGAEEVRRMLRQTMLIDNEAINQAVVSGQFSPEDIKKAQVAFANEVMFTDNPTEMPAWARKAITSETPEWEANLFRAMRLTYSMASFTVKTRALLRKHVMDETFLHHNPKMLALTAVVEPLVGAAVATAGAGIKSGIQRSLEGWTVQPQKQDALDREKEMFEKAFKTGWDKKGIAAKAELYLDLLTMGVAQEQIRLLGDMLLNIAADPKKAKGQAEYFGPDILEGTIGPIWETTVIHPLQYGLDEVKIMAGGKDVRKKTEHRTAKAAFEEMPVTQNVPAVKKMEAPPKTEKTYSYKRHRR